MQDIWPEAEYPQIHAENRNEWEAPIGYEEVCEAVWEMKRHKAPGPDGMTAEVIK